MLVAEEVAVNALLPGKIPGDCGVRVEEVVGDEYAVVARCLMRSCHIRSRSGRAGASLPGMEMSFVFIHYIFPSAELF